MVHFFKRTVIMLSLCMGAVVNAQTTPLLAAPEVAANAYLLIDVTANQILASKNIDAPIEPASLTKLMSAYVVFDALAALVGEPASIAEIRRQAATEGPDQTVVNMDQIWEEEAVTFLANQDGCGINQPMPDVVQPVQWVPPPGSMPPLARSHANL